jgi:leader peptidase (prepilin peptidase)/N-methyltransferase
LLTLSVEMALPALFVLGAVVGSFLNVVIHRLPIMIERGWPDDRPAGRADRYDLIVPRSACPRCGHRIGFFENIPLVSFAVLKGRCSACGGPISWRYPAVEAAAACLAVVLGWRFGLGWQLPFAIACAYALLCVLVIDVERMLIPDAISLPLLWAGLVANAFGLFAPAQAAILGAALGFAVLWGIGRAGALLLGREAMGGGDMKLMAALGAWLGWQQVPLVLFLAAAAGAGLGGVRMLLGRHRAGQPLPFGPFLAATGFVALVWGEEMLDAYWSAFGA